jgi:ATP-binding cassette, subfamily B, bacterial
MTLFGSPPAGSPFAGQTSAQTNRQAGLPFAGIPPELADRVRAIEAREPPYQPPPLAYDPGRLESPDFSLREFLRPHRWGLSISFALVLIATLANQAGPRLLAWAIDHGILARRFEVLLFAFGLYLLAIGVSVLTSYARIRYTGRLGHNLMYALRLRVFQHLQRLSLDFYTEERAGRLMTRMTSDIEAMTNLFQDGLTDLMVQGLTLIAITGVLMFMNAKLTLIVVLLVVPATLLLTAWYRRASDHGYGVVRDRISDVLSDLSESLAGIRLIAAFNRRDYNLVHHRNVIGAHMDANVAMARVGALYTPATELIGVISQLVLLWVGAGMVADGELTLGALTAFVLYLSGFFAPIQQLVQLYSTYQSGQAAVRKLRELLSARPSVPEKPGAARLPPITGRVELDHVSFSYNEGRPVLEDVSLAIEPGEIVALVGQTGAGKSTVAKLISRFYDPQQGSVRIDGHDLRDVTQESLRGQLGIVPQEPFLFHGTIRDNLIFGAPEASQHELDEACRAVGLDEVLQRMERGLDTPVFERGAALSAGERQLIALGRAVLAKPRILILDEAMSNVDLQSEARIERALDNVLGGRTAIIIAHRMATARRAHRVAVIEAGKLQELGSHEQLLQLGGRYASMYATWTSTAQK